MIHPDTELRFKSPEMGWGVYATAPIPRGTVVWTLCQLDQRISPTQRAALTPAARASLDVYAYIDAAGDSILCWDHGRFVNHACDPAMLAIGQHHEIAVRDLAPGDELTCDYGTLNLLSALHCECGSAACRGVVQAGELAATNLATRIDATVAAALGAATRVRQPLLDHMLDPDGFREIAAGRSPAPPVALCHAGAR